MAARKNNFDDKLARFKALEDAPDSQVIAELRKLLGDDNAFFIGEAAQMAKNQELRDLEKDLVDAGRRLLQGKITDRGCIAKRNVLNALVTFDTHAPDLYLAGLRYIQWDHSFGPPEETGGAVRGLCAHALVRIDHPSAIFEISPLLFDEQPEVRIAAAEALVATGDRTCAAILHVRFLAGENKPDALEALYRCLLAIDCKRYLPLVTKGLSDGEEAAALALGESRLPEALAILKDALRTALGDLEGTILLSMGLLRTEEATAYLSELVEEAHEGRAIKAIEALGLHRHDSRMADKLAIVVKKRKSKKLATIFAEKFGRDV
jgi:HEAT repeat protein